MADRRPPLPADDLEQALRDLSARLDWPVASDLAPAVRARLDAPRRRLRWSRLAPDASARRLAWAAVAVAVAITTLLIASGDTRSTVADRLGLPGVSITTEPAATVPAQMSLDPGDPSTLDAFTAQAGRLPVSPPASALGAPDSVSVVERNGTVQVVYSYLPRPDLPEVGDSGVSLLVIQFAGRTNESFIQKQLGSDTTLELVEVNGATGWWIAGAPHVFAYEDANGDIQEETLRLAGNVLLWEQEGLTLRIESALDRDAVLALAASMAAGAD